VPALRTVTEFLVAIGLVVTLVSNYLIINKLWKRRAVREVAESISVGAALLGLSTAAPFLALFLLVDHSPLGAAKTLVGIVTGLVFVLVGSGLWVTELGERRFFSLLIRSLRLERKESGDLIRWMVQPKGADRIVNVLHQLAAVDGHIDESEAILIRTFAEQWHLSVPGFDEAHAGDLFALRQSVVDYLAVHPPREQAAQLFDLMQLLVKADAQESWEETLALDEIGGMMGHYLAADDAAAPAYEVLIVPQSEAQVGAVQTLLPDATEKMVRGGRVFSVGTYFSAQYAEMVCQKYIALGLFTAMVAETKSGARLQNV
jgi:hypothetical protein